MADQPDFDAADVAAEILGLDEAEPAQVAPPVPQPAKQGGALGWFLLVALVVAVTIAISMALQLSPESSAPPEPPICGGLYADCCDDWDGRDDDQSPCIDECDKRDSDRASDRDERGLFDTEENFADRSRWPSC